MPHLIKYFYRFLVVFHTKRISLQPRINIGHDTTIYTKSKILNISKLGGGGIKIGCNCLIGRAKDGYHTGMPFYTTILSDGNSSTVNIGDNCRINGAYIHAQKGITIGCNCVIAAGVNIIDSNGHQVVSKDRTTGRDEPKEIVIGNNVWIGINAVILKGTHIGDNCVVSAGSVVKGEYPSDCIIAGNPAQIKDKIKYK